MTEAREQAEKLDRQLSVLLNLVNQENFSKAYDGDVAEIKTLLKRYLKNLRTDMRQMSDVEAQNFFAGDPRFDNAKRGLIEDIEAIGVELQFEINPKLEHIAKQLAEKAQQAGVRNKGLLQQACEALDSAIASVTSPVTKATALITAIKMLLSLF